MTSCRLSRFSDAVLFFRNDVVKSACGSGQAPTSVDSSIGYNQMNRYISDCINGIAIPTDTLTPEGSVEIAFNGRRQLLVYSTYQVYGSCCV